VIVVKTVLKVSLPPCESCGDEDVLGSNPKLLGGGGVHHEPHELSEWPLHQGVDQLLIGGGERCQACDGLFLHGEDVGGEGLG
jgi:hypothetical protein